MKLLYLQKLINKNKIYTIPLGGRMPAKGFIDLANNITETKVQFL